MEGLGHMVAADLHGNEVHRAGPSLANRNAWPRMDGVRLPAATWNGVGEDQSVHRAPARNQVSRYGKAPPTEQGCHRARPLARRTAVLSDENAAKVHREGFDRLGAPSVGQNILRRQPPRGSARRTMMYSHGV